MYHLDIRHLPRELDSEKQSLPPGIGKARGDSWLLESQVCLVNLDELSWRVEGSAVRGARCRLWRQMRQAVLDENVSMGTWGLSTLALQRSCAQAMQVASAPPLAHTSVSSYHRKVSLQGKLGSLEFSHQGLVIAHVIIITIFKSRPTVSQRYYQFPLQTMSLHQ